MTRLEKKLKAFLAAPQNMRWSELKTLLVGMGFLVEQRKAATHWTILHPDVPNFRATVALKEGELKKPIYASRIRSLIRSVLSMREGDEHGEP